jgi:hypothetical protein
MIMDKSYVTMEKCVICGKPTNALFLDRRLRSVFERYTTTPTSVCDACRKKYLSEGVMMINPQSGRLLVLKDEAFKRLFPQIPIPKGKITFAEEEVFERIQGMQQKMKNYKKLRKVI